MLGTCKETKSSKFHAFLRMLIMTDASGPMRDWCDALTNGSHRGEAWRSSFNAIIGRAGDRPYIKHPRT